MNLETDILVIGGGSAGCMAAIATREHNPDMDVVIIEKGVALIVLRLSKEAPSGRPSNGIRESTKKREALGDFQLIQLDSRGSTFSRRNPP